MGSPRHFPIHTHLIWKYHKKGIITGKKGIKKKNNTRTAKHTIPTFTRPQEVCFHNAAREKQSVPSFALTDPLTDDITGFRTPPCSLNEGLGRRGQTKGKERDFTHSLSYLLRSTDVSWQIDTNWDKKWHMKTNGPLMKLIFFKGKN